MHTKPGGPPRVRGGADEYAFHTGPFGFVTFGDFFGAHSAIGGLETIESVAKEAPATPKDMLRDAIRDANLSIFKQRSPS